MAATDAPADADDFPVGSFCSFKTTLGDDFQAHVVSFHRTAGLLILQEGLKPGHRRDMRILKTSFIKEFSLLRQDEDPFDWQKCYLDVHTLHTKADSAIRHAETGAERIGVGVTSQAQDIFDALAKTLPVHWDKTSIVVMNDIRVSSPYTLESIRGGKPDATRHVRKVIERARMQSRGNSQ